MDKPYASSLYGWTPNYDQRLRRLCDSIGHQPAPNMQRCVTTLVRPTHRNCQRRDWTASLVFSCVSRSLEAVRWDLDHVVWLRARGTDRRRPYALLNQPYGEMSPEAIDQLAKLGLTTTRLEQSPYGHGTAAYLIRAEVIRTDTGTTR